jgi:hypothetical protein
MLFYYLDSIYNFTFTYFQIYYENQTLIDTYLHILHIYVLDNMSYFQCVEPH